MRIIKNMGKSLASLYGTIGIVFISIYMIDFNVLDQTSLNYNVYYSNCYWNAVDGMFNLGVGTLFIYGVLYFTAFIFKELSGVSEFCDPIYQERLPLHTARRMVSNEKELLAQKSQQISELERENNILRSHFSDKERERKYQEIENIKLREQIEQYELSFSKLYNTTSELNRTFTLLMDQSQKEKERLKVVIKNKENMLCEITNISEQLSNEITILNQKLKKLKKKNKKDIHKNKKEKQK